MCMVFRVESVEVFAQSETSRTSLHACMRANHRKPPHHHTPSHPHPLHTITQFVTTYHTLHSMPSHIITHHPVHLIMKHVITRCTITQYTLLISSYTIHFVDLHTPTSTPSSVIFVYVRTYVYTWLVMCMY